jgi:polyhydroxyalkanoate synthesis regulator phasin
MKKLSKIELDVVVNEVVNSIKLIEENKCKEIFNKSKNKDLFLSKVSEIEELESKLDLLKKEINEIENKFKEDNLRVYFMNKNNRSFNSNKVLI